MKGPASSTLAISLLSVPKIASQPRPVYLKDHALLQETYPALPGPVYRPCTVILSMFLSIQHCLLWPVYRLSTWAISFVFQCQIALLQPVRLPPWLFSVLFLSSIPLAVDTLPSLCALISFLQRPSSDPCPNCLGQPTLSCFCPWI